MAIYEFARNIGASLGSKGDFPNRRPRMGFTPSRAFLQAGGDSCTPEKNHSLREVFYRFSNSQFEITSFSKSFLEFLAHPPSLRAASFRLQREQPRSTDLKKTNKKTINFVLYFYFLLNQSVIFDMTRSCEA